MDYRHPSHRWVPAWVWRAFTYLLLLGVLYQLIAWAWE